MPCDNTARSWRRPERTNSSENSGGTCSAPSPAIRSPGAQDAPSHAPSNEHPHPSRSSTVPDESSSNYPIATIVGMVDPANIEGLTNRHSGRFLILYTHSLAPEHHAF